MEGKEEKMVLKGDAFKAQAVSNINRKYGTNFTPEQYAEAVKYAEKARRKAEALRRKKAKARMIEILTHLAAKAKVTLDVEALKKRRYEAVVEVYRRAIGVRTKEEFRRTTA